MSVERLPVVVGVADRVDNNMDEGHGARLLAVLGDLVAHILSEPAPRFSVRDVGTGVSEGEVGGCQRQLDRHRHGLELGPSRNAVTTSGRCAHTDCFVDRLGGTRGIGILVPHGQHEACGNADVPRKLEDESENKHLQ
jgi:hypothetical protein